MVRRPTLRRPGIRPSDIRSRVTRGSCTTRMCLSQWAYGAGKTHAERPVAELHRPACWLKTAAGVKSRVVAHPRRAGAPDFAAGAASLRRHGSAWKRADSAYRRCPGAGAVSRERRDGSVDESDGNRATQGAIRLRTNGLRLPPANPPAYPVPPRPSARRRSRGR